MSANACAVCVNGYMRSGGPRGRLMTCWCCHGYRHAGEGNICPHATTDAADREESARMPRGHRIGDQRVEDLPDWDEVEP